MSLFALPVVGRAGLGNMLFPWARAEIFADQSGARILAPRWTSIRVGPYLRREPVKRNYIGFFSEPQHVRGLSRLAITLGAKYVAEADRDAPNDGATSLIRPTVVVFEGIDGLFEALVKHPDLIRRRLWAMTRQPMRATGAEHGGRFIAMHIRRGDLTRQRLLPEQLAQYTPISWFVGMVRAVRRHRLLASAPIVVFTDGSGDEVRDVLSFDNVHLHRPRTAIADLWALTHANLLFASGFSTFSMWASFLGRMPTIYAPGKLQQKIQSGPSSMEVELGEGAEIPLNAWSADGCGNRYAGATGAGGLAVREFHQL